MNWKLDIIFVFRFFALASIMISQTFLEKKCRNKEKNHQNYKGKINIDVH